MIKADPDLDSENLTGFNVEKHPDNIDGILVFV